MKEKKPGRPKKVTKAKEAIKSGSNEAVFSPMILPSDLKELEKFISANKLKLMGAVLSSIEYSIDTKLHIAEAFRFRDSEFIVTILDSNFKENVDNIYKYYIDNELYELCDRIKKLNVKLSNVGQKSSGK